MKDFAKDYGALVAASIAAVAALTSAIINLWWQNKRERDQAKREREMKQTYWLRELRLPRYLAFLDATQEYSTSIFMEYGIWDGQDMGPPPAPLPLPEAEHSFQRALTEVTLAGPPAVAEAARRVQFSLWRYSGDLQSGEPGSLWRYRKEADDGFLTAAGDALGLGYVAGGGVHAYKDWRQDAQRREEAAEAAQEASWEERDRRQDTTAS